MSSAISNAVRIFILIKHKKNAKDRTCAGNNKIKVFYSKDFIGLWRT